MKLKPDRIKYWLGVGAKPSERVQVFLKKYLRKFEELAKTEAEAPPAGAASPSA